MKWGGYNTQAGERTNKLLGKLFRSKALYTLMLIATLGMLLGASIKWHPN